MKKEEHAIVLDYLPHGYPLEGKMIPIVQAIGEENLILLELVPRRGIHLEPEQKVYIGEGKREEIYYILGRLPREKLTEQAKDHLEKFIAEAVQRREAEFVDFFNKAEAVNKRVHQIELLPGLGKKYTKDIVEQRNIKEFVSFEDIKKRIPSLPFPEKAVEKRVFQELTEFERYNLFTR